MPRLDLVGGLYGTRPQLDLKRGTCPAYPPLPFPTLSKASLHYFLFKNRVFVEYDLFNITKSYKKKLHIYLLV